VVCLRAYSNVAGRGTDPPATLLAPYRHFKRFWAAFLYDGHWVCSHESAILISTPDVSTQ